MEKQEKCCGPKPEKWVVEIYEPDKPYNKLIFVFYDFDEACQFISTATNHSEEELNFTVYKESEDK